MEETKRREHKLNRFVTVVSIVIPIVVALLFRVRIPGVERLGFLPPIYAAINGVTAVLLVAAVLAIKKGNRNLHQKLITACMGLSTLFLVLYVAYHMTSDSTTYGGEGVIKYIYLFILVTHIVLSILVIPLVLKTFIKGYLGDFIAHRKLSKFTFPIWLYVAVTGVVVYLMISPYYVN